MNVAFLGESPADEAVIRILTAAAVGIPINPVDVPLRSRGWPSVRNQLPSIIRFLHFRSDADALVMVVDSNSTSVSQRDENNNRVPHSDSRLVELQSMASKTLADIGPRPHGARLRIAIGIAVPALEGWLRCGVDPHVNEAAWERGLQSGDCPYSKAQLKQDVYGTISPSSVLQTERAGLEATRLANDLGILEGHFPIGFGSLVDELRTWPTTD